MGAAALLIGSLGFGFLSSMQEQQAAEQSAKDEIDELYRQQQEANKAAQEQKSDRAREGDKLYASALVAMETVGGAGSQNEARIAAEISGNTGLDLARIEGNRRREVGALRASMRAARKGAASAIRASQANFLGSALGATSSYLDNKAKVDASKNTLTSGSTTSHSTLLSTYGGIGR